MGLEDVQGDEDVKIVEGKGKGKEEERKEGEAAHKDDDHYFESYQYNGACSLLRQNPCTILSRVWRTHVQTFTRLC